jgi:integrase
MTLTDAEIRAAKPSEKPYKLFDGRGLYLLINPDGSRWWRVKYRYGGKEKLVSVGVYRPGQPGHVGAKEARNSLDAIKRQLREGVDPGAARKAEKSARVDRAEGALELVAREWHTKQSAVWSADYAEKELGQLVRHVFPRIGGDPIRELTSRDLLDVLQRIEKKGRAETAHRVRRSLSAIMRYAVLTHRAEVDPSAALKGALAPVPEKHFAAITEPKMAGGLMRAIHGYDGGDVTRCAMELAALTFVRPGELRGAKWEEFTFDLTDAPKGKKPATPEPQWRIPASRMKMGEQHIVPLSRQAVASLRELHKITGPEGFLFPSVRSKSRCMSENTVNAALRTMGFAQDEMTGHGFRHMASTLLHERGYRSEWIERQLAHGDRNSVRARYNFAEHLPERRKMMQDWADYLDSLASGVKVVAIGSAKKRARAKG